MYYNYYLNKYITIIFYLKIVSFLLHKNVVIKSALIFTYDDMYTSISFYVHYFYTNVV